MITALLALLHRNFWSYVVALGMSVGIVSVTNLKVSIPPSSTVPLDTLCFDGFNETGVRKPAEAGVAWACLEYFPCRILPRADMQYTEAGGTVARLARPALVKVRYLCFKTPGDSPVVVNKVLVIAVGWQEQKSGRIATCTIKLLRQAERLPGFTGAIHCPSINVFSTL